VFYLLVLTDIFKYAEILELTRFFVMKGKEHLPQWCKDFLSLTGWYTPPMDDVRSHGHTFVAAMEMSVDVP